jgi:hypothetical protein
MGLTRQGVQRIADLLVERGLAEYRRNPDHRRAKLLACTEAGYWSIRRISLVAHPWGNRIGGEVGAVKLSAALTTMRQLIAIIEASHPAAGRSRTAVPSALGDSGGVAAIVLRFSGNRHDRGSAMRLVASLPGKWSRRRHSC